MRNITALRAVFCGFLLCTVLLSAGQAGGALQKKSKGAAAAKKEPARAKIDVCSLLTSAEIEAVQGEPVTQATPKPQPGGGMLLSQCLFHTKTFAKSVTLSLALPDPDKPSALTPRKFWQQQFHKAESKEKEKPAHKTSKKSESRQEEEDLPKPQAIKGLGDEAYWVSNPIAGALYVLQGDAFIRISIGGIREDAARIEKSKALANDALKRLG